MEYLEGALYLSMGGLTAGLGFLTYTLIKAEKELQRYSEEKHGLHYESGEPETLLEVKNPFTKSVIGRLDWIPRRRIE